MAPAVGPATAPFDLDDALQRARVAARHLPAIDRSALLRRVADALRRDAPAILAANGEDVARARDAGVADALVDRLALSPARLAAIADAVVQVADLPDPVGRVLEGWRAPNGLEVRAVTVPFGVIGMVYESRPNVTVDAFALAFRAGSAAVLRGSADALASNRALVASMRGALASAPGVPAEVVDALTLIDDPDRARVTELLQARGRVDLVIPRGGAGLIRHVVETARVPVIETGVGNCHLYLHDDGDRDMALALLLDGKVRRPGVCNALETLLVHRDAADEWLPRAAAALREHGVTLHACERGRAVLAAAGLGDGVHAATEEDWATEYLGPEIAVRVVDGLDDAIAHLHRYGSQHSEAIVTRSRAAGRRFQSEVDAAVVYVNASTRFTDGFEFGFGAEIGISTQKLHARGPMGLRALVTVKHLVDGDGQTRG
jgi:glutamate-5-semialdehyde dehydrogenase